MSNTNIQAILFDRKKFNLITAKQWIVLSGFHPIKYHITDRYIRARLHTPVKGRAYRTVPYNGYRGGIKIII